jgi:hypothetical protein
VGVNVDAPCRFHLSTLATPFHNHVALFPQTMPEAIELMNIPS